MLERIEYDALCRQYSRDDVDEVVELLTDALCTTRPTLRVGGEDIPAPQVKDRLLRLDYSHIEYVFDCLRETSTDVRNIRAYLLTALYNAPTTINHYYGAAVRRDWPSGSRLILQSESDCVSTKILGGIKQHGRRKEESPDWRILYHGAVQGTP